MSPSALMQGFSFLLSIINFLLHYYSYTLQSELFWNANYLEVNTTTVCKTLAMTLGKSQCP